MNLQPGRERPLSIDYYFSVLSDWAYFGGERLENLARRQGAQINYKPMKLAEVYAGTGGIILQKRSKQRQDYRVVELERWRDHLGIPITIHPRFYPTDDTLAACAIIAASRARIDPGKLTNLIHRAIWVEEQDISDEATLLRIIAVLNPEPEKLLDAARSSSIRDELDRNTREAQGRGVFGSPFYFFNDEPFWGQDRLDFLEAAMVRARSERFTQKAT
jgi:2-hydroxychromene-2-carboxylate isomerase